MTAGTLETQRPAGHPHVTLAVLTTAGIAYALQQTMVIPALPSLRNELHTTTGWATWLVSAFLLTSCVASPLFGRLGDQYGRERMLLISLMIFFGGSVGASLAPNIWTLILFRAIQGTGGAVLPLSFAIIKERLSGPRIPFAIGIVSSVFAVGGAVGFVLSGVLIEYLSWRFVFVIAAAVTAVAIVLVVLLLPKSEGLTRARLDVRGALLLSSGLLVLLVALTEGNLWGWQSTRVLALFLASAVCLTTWGIFELHTPDPMVDMRMLAHRPVFLTNITGLIGGFSLFGSFVLVANFVETPHEFPERVARLVDYGFNATPMQAGLYLLPGSLAGVCSGALAGVLGRRYGSKWPLSLGLGLAASGLASLAMWHGRPWQVVLAVSVMGSGFPFTFAAMATLIVDSVRSAEIGVATGMNTVMRTIGGVIGSQVSVAILTTETIGTTSVPTQSAFVVAFVVGSSGGFLAATLALFVTPRRETRPLALAGTVE